MKHPIYTKLYALVTVFLLVFGFPSTAHAQGIIYGDSIPAGTVVDQDVFLFGRDVILDGTVNGNVFIIGNQVQVNGKVDGSLVLIGQNAVIGGDISGGTYVLALTLDLPSGALLQRDLYIATVSLTSGADSVIARDLFAIGLDSGLSGHVERNLHTAIGPIQLYNGLMHLLGFDELTIKLHIDIQSSAPVYMAWMGSLAKPGLMMIARPSFKPALEFDWAKWGLDNARLWAVLFLLALVGLWLARRPLEATGTQVRARPWRSFWTGLVVLIAAINLFLLMFLLFILFFAVGLGLTYLGVWQLAVAIWIVSFSALVVAGVALWLLILYGAKIIVCYAVFAWAFEKLFHRVKTWILILALLAGTLVYVLLRSIPYAGIFIDLIVTATGMGAAWLALRSANQKPVVVEALPGKGIENLPGKVVETLPVKKVRRIPKNG